VCTRSDAAAGFGLLAGDFQEGGQFRLGQTRPDHRATTGIDQSVKSNGRYTRVSQEIERVWGWSLRLVLSIVVFVMT